MKFAHPVWVWVVVIVLVDIGLSVSVHWFLEVFRIWSSK